MQHRERQCIQHRRFCVRPYVAPMRLIPSSCHFYGPQDDHPQCNSGKHHAKLRAILHAKLANLSCVGIVASVRCWDDHLANQILNELQDERPAFETMYACGCKHVVRRT